jgi:cysteine sulfinate desulfinase/cysteine desulfurase-like protein
MESRKQVIYLVSNATTPNDKRVLDAMMPQQVLRAIRGKW